jgi:hypothetical protein
VARVIAFGDYARGRRRQEARALHAQCCTILAATVAHARVAAADAPAREQPMRLARLRKLEALEAYALALV